MNATIEKIIGLLFEDLEDSEEVRAIHEEICTNCQERYEDMLSMGMTQDEAIGSVVESLRGMEEMLRPYPRKKPQQEMTDAYEETDECDEEETYFEIDPSRTPVSEVRLLHLGSTDIELCESMDGLLHIDCDDCMPLAVNVQDGLLTVSLKNSPRSQSAIESPAASSAMAGAQHAGGASKGFLDNLFNNLFRGLSFSAGGGTLKMALPAVLRPTIKIDASSGSVVVSSLELNELHLATASGDIRLEDLVVQTIKCSSSSGDISLSHLTVDHLQLSSVSGDIHARQVSSTFETRLSTTSGDVRWEGDSPVFAVNTISGDIDHASGIFADLHFKTVSGDVSMDVLGGALTAVDGKTTSGDVRLRLPSDQRCCFKCHSVSGDIRKALADDPSSPVVVSITTSSGDISIR